MKHIWKVDIETCYLSPPAIWSHCPLPRQNSKKTENFSEKKRKWVKHVLKDKIPVLTKGCKIIHFFCHGMNLVSSQFSFLAIRQILTFLL